MMHHISLSQEHLDNSRRINDLGASGKIGKEIGAVLTLTNNLEEIARDIAANYNFTRTKELDFAYEAAQDHIKKMTQKFGLEHGRLVERAKQSYNAILRSAKVTEEYLLEGTH